ncbi:hypothetical protein CYFUS_000456 [Cystobacter fuscus]|uniref:Uncharacterized protein n=1 Tax=Cystobacter fuscus TaxID=43 RepID=A0A250ITH6_9BACT|nr:hypothetical protein CYFUS_000456 [Cystobacter fuscus]
MQSVGLAAAMLLLLSACTRVPDGPSNVLARRVRP